MGKRSFANHPSPFIVDVVRERTPYDAIGKMKNARIDGAMGYDLHLSCLDAEYKNVESIRRIISGSALPVMALSYSQNYYQEAYEETEEERIGLLKMAIEAGADCIDMQNFSFDRPSRERFDREHAPEDMIFAHTNPREVTLNERALARQKELISFAHERGCEVLISCHTFVPMCAEELLCLARHLESKGPDVIKIVGAADTAEELAEALLGMLLLKQEIRSCKVHFHCVGAFGKVTRLVNPMLGAYLIFCTDRYSAGSNFAQLDLKTVADAFRTLDWRMDALDGGV